MHSITHGLNLSFKMAPGKLQLVHQAELFLYSRVTVLYVMFLLLRDKSLSIALITVFKLVFSTGFAFKTVISCILRVKLRFQLPCSFIMVTSFVWVAT